MWPVCTANSFAWSLLPLLIGFLTGWWAWAHYRSPEPAYVAPEPVVVAPPEPVVRSSFAPLPDVGGAIAGTVSGIGTAAMGALTAIGIPAAIGDPDDLTLIKGVGEKLNETLNGLGVYRFDQIARWSASDVAKVNAHLGAFSGRIERDNWIDQSSLLARNAISEFEARYGTLGSENH